LLVGREVLKPVRTLTGNRLAVRPRMANWSVLYHHSSQEQKFRATRTPLLHYTFEWWHRRGSSLLSRSSVSYSILSWRSGCFWLRQLSCSITSTGFCHSDHAPGHDSSLERKINILTIQQLWRMGQLWHLSTVGLLISVIPLLGVDVQPTCLKNCEMLANHCLWPWSTIRLMGSIIHITFCFCLGTSTRLLALRLRTQLLKFSRMLRDQNRNLGSACSDHFLSIFCNLSIVATAFRQLYAISCNKDVQFWRFFADVGSLLHLVAFSGWIGSSKAMMFQSMRSSCSSWYPARSYSSILARSSHSIVSHPYQPAHFSRPPIPICCSRYGSESPFFSRAGMQHCSHHVDRILVFIMVYSFPGEENPTLPFMDWGILIYGVVIIFSLLCYWGVGGIIATDQWSTSRGACSVWLESQQVLEVSWDALSIWT